MVELKKNTLPILSHLLLQSKRGNVSIAVKLYHQEIDQETEIEPFLARISSYDVVSQTACAKENVQMKKCHSVAEP